MTLAIYCAGGLGKEFIAFARSITRWDYMIFVDDVIDASEYCGATVYRYDAVANLPDDVEFIIANGEPAARKALYEKVKGAGYRFATLVSPYASILPGAQIGEGCVVMDCGVSADVVLGENVVLNTKVTLGHDVVIGAHSYISANSFVGGHTQIGSCVYMAPGAMAKDRITVGDNAIISLGAVLLRDVRSGAIMVGNPARHLGENDRGKVFGMFEE